MVSIVSVHSSPKNEKEPVKRWECGSNPFMKTYIQKGEEKWVKRVSFSLALEIKDMDISLRLGFPFLDQIGIYGL